MSLKNHLNEIQIAIRGGQFPNEAAVSRGVVMRLLQALGWPVRIHSQRRDNKCT